MIIMTASLILYFDYSLLFLIAITAAEAEAASRSTNNIIPLSSPVFGVLSDPAGSFGSTVAGSF